MKHFILLILSSLFILSCISSPGKSKDLDRPKWIDVYPVSEDLYIGIGSSKTGNESEDRLIAEKRALSGIASSISTKISSEMDIISKEDSKGLSYDYSAESIKAVVEQSLSGVETVETYYSESSGAWVYMTLSKELWEQIQLNEMNKLVSRIKDFLLPSISDFENPLLTKLKDLIKAKKLILESPYAGMLNTDFLGENGSFIDIIDTLLGEHLDSIEYELELGSSTIEMGQSLSFNIKIKSYKSKVVGNIPFLIVSEDSDKLIKGFTAINGDFSSELKSDKLQTKKNYLSLKLDEALIGFDSSFSNLTFSKITKVVQVLAVSVGLKLEIEPDNINLLGINGTVEALFSGDNLPFKLGDDKNTFIKIVISVSDFPRLNEDDFYMAKSSAVISLIRGEDTVFSYESESVKDGGLDINQAHNRSVTKLIKDLKKSGNYINGIVTALAIK